MKTRNHFQFGMLLLALFMVGCTKPNDDYNVRVTTYTPTDITNVSASLGGDVIVEGNLPLRELGVCWSNSFNPTVFDNKQSTGVCNQPFVCTVNNLSPNSNYHVRAYAYDGGNYYYGDDKTFTTLSIGGGGTGGDTNYEEMILGGWGCETNNGWNVTFFFNRDEPGKLNYQYTDNISGITANANYTIQGSVITALYDHVAVYDAYFNPTTINGFTHGQSITVTYTIQSISDDVLEMVESLQGKMLRLERYN